MFELLKSYLKKRNKLEKNIKDSKDVEIKTSKFENGTKIVFHKSSLQWVSYYFILNYKNDRRGN